MDKPKSIAIMVFIASVVLTACQSAAGAASTGTGSISGTIVDVAGKPIEKAQVITDPAIAAAETGADGKYTLSGIPSGIFSVTAAKHGYNAADKTGIVVQGGKTAVVTLSLQQAAPFPLAKVRALSTNDKEGYPEKNVRITLHGGYADHDNNVVVTSGLNNVPVGTYVYLQGKDTDENGEKIVGWSWKVIGPHEVPIKVENEASQQPRFMANTEGRYEVSTTATKEKGSKASSSLTVYAGHYIGAQNCALCHSGSVKQDQVTKWRETGHATKFEDFFGSYSATSDYCVGCHTTGYNETDKAGGFDDAARLAGWSPDQGSFMEWASKKGLTLADIKRSPAGNFINIQCENCHGPGSVHTKTKSFEPGVCSQCHSQEVQWRLSGHAKTGSANMHMAENTECVKCHTGEGFVQVTIRNQEPVFPEMATETKPANLVQAGDQPPVACAACHDPHAFTEPFQGANGPASRQLRLSGGVTMPNGATVDAKESAVCVSCHADKRDLAYKAQYLAGKQARGAHDDTQSDVFYAVTAAAFDFGKGDYASSDHPTEVKEGCIQCHMAANPVMDPGPDGKAGTRDDVKAMSAGGHSWNMAGDYNGKRVENVGACTKCHAELTTFNRKAKGDYNGNGKIEGIQDEVKGLLDLVAKELPKDEKGAVLLAGIDKANLTEKQRMALWNYALIANEGSKGVHNAPFAVQVLQRTFEELTGKPVPGATVMR